MKVLLHREPWQRGGSLNRHTTIYGLQATQLRFAWLLGLLRSTYPSLLCTLRESSHNDAAQRSTGSFRVNRSRSR